MLCKLQKAENIFMTRLATDEALATEVRAWDYFTVNACIGKKPPQSWKQVVVSSSFRGVSGQVQKMLVVPVKMRKTVKDK